MYGLIYLPLAKHDIEKIATYILEDLNSPQTALNILDCFEKSINKLKDFPYSYAIYHFVGVLKKEYRFITVKNYIIFYTIFEKEKIVEIQRVLYGKRDLSQII